MIPDGDVSRSKVGIASRDSSSGRLQPVREPLAIIGIGCRFPAGARGVEGFWGLLRSGGDAIGEVPPDRFDISALYEPTPGIPGKMTTRWGGFLERADLFDADFFCISPREAARMDPQQRLLLEVGWEAIEDAGLLPERLAGSRTGVFTGVCYDDYCTLRHEDPSTFELYTATGSARSVLAGRLSFALGLQGASVAVDAACASSLVAVHLACQSLRTGESELALAAGINLILHPASTIGFSQANMLAPDGRCKAFDARANGFVRSDGVGVVVLKPLSRALADGDRIYAAIRGSAVNNDGKSGGLMMTPSRSGQEEVLRQAYADARLSPGLVQYVEAHGTGTSVGDPVETGALGAVLAGGRPPDRPCRIGSVKSNLGHTEGAAGIAGLIKAALCLWHRTLVPSLHCLEPNPRIPWAELPLVVQRELAPWPESEPAGPRYAGVSAFGISGTNSHVVLEEAGTATRPESSEAGPHLLTLSAPSAPALRAVAATWAGFLHEAGAGGDLAGIADIAFTAGARRTHHDHRLSLVAPSATEAAGHLEAFLASETRSGMTAGRRRPSPPKVVFVFPGQGSQWLGMGRELMAREPAFRQALERYDEALRPHVDWSLLEQLQASPESSRLEEVNVVQPVLFSVQSALAALWRSWGIEPDAVIGQSLGEVAAAHVAGALSLEDAARVICLRSQIVRAAASGRGGMAAVDLSLEEARRTLAGREDRLSIAVSSSPASTVIAGDAEALDEVLGELEARAVFCRRIKVDYASHSPHMEPLRPRLLEALSGLRPVAAAVPLCSTVTARFVGGAEMDAEYWVRNLREPVLFADSIRLLLEQGHEVFLEVSPHPILLSAIQQSLLHLRREGTVLPSLRREEPERATLLSSLGALHVQGRSPRWPALFAAGARPATLPLYPWQGEPYPLREPDAVGGPAWRPLAGPGRGDGGAVHPLLGPRLAAASPAGASYWETGLSLRRTPFLGDHRVQGEPVLPAAAYLEMAFSAAVEALGGEPSEVAEVADVTFDKALFLPREGERRVQLALEREGPGAAIFRIFSQGEEGWVRHAAGTVRGGRSTPAGEAPSLDELQRRCSEGLPAADHYRAMEARGLHYGRAFQGVEDLWRGEGEALARIRLPEGAPAARADYRLHPVLLDAAFQTLAAALPGGESASSTWLPVGLASLAVTERLTGRLAGPLWAHARLLPGDGQSREGDVLVLGEAGDLLLEARGLRMQRLEAQQGHGADELEDWFFALEWQPAAPVEPAVAAAGSWLIFADEAGIGRDLAVHLAAAGQRCSLVFPGQGFDRAAPGLFQIEPESPEHYDRLLAAVATDEPPRGLVHLWSLTAPAGELDAAALGREQALGCGAVTLLLQALSRAGLGGAPRLWLVTAGAQPAAPGDPPSRVAAAPLWGLGRVIAYEHPELRCARVDLSASPAAQEVAALAAELCAGGAEDQVALRGGERRVARLVRRPPAAEAAAFAGETAPAGERNFRLEITRAGILDRLALVAVPRRPPGPGEVEVEVVAAGLNFIDVMRAMGIYPGQPEGRIGLGAELAGRVAAVGPGVEDLAVGEEVMGFSHSSRSSIARFAVTDARLVTRKPSRLSHAEAATLPTTFLTALYALGTLAHLSAGETVLIHAAAGGVGLAAIQIARAAGAEVFATAGSEEKREFLRALGVRHVMDSRTLDFARQIREITGGRGVDVVLNSLAGEAIPRSLSAVAPYGRFVEIGKRDIYGGSRLDLSPFRNNLSYFAIDIDRMALERPEILRALLRELADRVEKGELGPLPARLFPVSEHVEAFRLMAQARHIGKIVLLLDDAAARVAVPPEERSRFRPDATYLLTGGLGGLGLQVARWLVGRGARHLALMGRSAPGPSARQVLAGLESAGATVRTITGDVSLEADVDAALAAIDGSMPPLDGVIHAAGLLDDGILLQLDRARWRRVLAPKVDGAWNLHRRTADRPLRHFILFSSAASVLGSPGQGNYAAANAFLDALAHHRRALGLPAVSLNWGPWTEVGLAAAQANRGERLSHRGFGGISPEAGLECLRRALEAGGAQLAVMPFDLAAWRQFYPAAAGSPLFAGLRQGEEGEGAAGGRPGGLGAEAVLATPPAERRSRVEDFVKEQLARVLGLSAARLDSERPMSSLGIDSLMAIELKNRLESDLGVTVPVVTLLRGPSVAEVAAQLVEQIESAPACSADSIDPGLPAPQLAGGDLLERLDELPEADVDALLATLLAEEAAEG